MKKIALLLSLILLTGAGCESRVRTDVTSNNARVMEVTTDTRDADGAAAQVEVDTETQVETNTQVTPPVVETGGTSVGVEIKAPVKEIGMEAGNFFFEGDSIAASPGQEITIQFSQVTGSHTFVIDEIGLKKQISENGTVTFKAPMTTGRYVYYCDLGSHRELGMEGTLVVE